MIDMELAITGKALYSVFSMKTRPDYPAVKPAVLTVMMSSIITLQRKLPGSTCCVCSRAEPQFNSGNSPADSATSTICTILA